jgi:hypothetical protein
MWHCIMQVQTGKLGSLSIIGAYALFRGRLIGLSKP